MPIKRNADQRRETLEEFYIDLSKTTTNSLVDVGKDMLQFVEMVNVTFRDTLLWGLTSHARLVIQNGKETDWFIIVSSIGMKEYYFEYLLPENRRPWKYATVRGEAKTLDEAKHYLLISMRECEGWTDNFELKKLLKDHNLSS